MGYAEAGKEKLGRAVPERVAKAGEQALAIGRHAVAFALSI